MKYIINLSDDTFSGPVTDSDTSFKQSRSIYEVIKSYSDNAWIETGLLPVSGAGLLSYRAAFGSEQIIYQLPPGIYTVRWGETERDANASNYSLAHPWKVIIADFNNNSFLGLRHFFSPHPITYWDQPLYIVNLPNTNTIGYNNTSVGWTCLYLNDDTTKYTLDQKIEYIIHRESGLSEPYNDSNMRNTDGTRFYQRNGAPQFMYDPSAWQEKTLAEGFDWICNPDLLIPLHVSLSGHAETHFKDSPEYTLRRASFEPYAAYYTDYTYNKPFNVLSKDGFSPEHRSLWLTPIISSGQLVDQEPALSPKELLAQPVSFSFSKEILSYIKNGWTCDSCENKYSNEYPTYDVVTSHTYSEEYDEYSFDFSTYCSSCLDDSTVYVEEHDAHFALHEIVWSDYEDRWLLPETSYICKDCSSAYSLSQNKVLEHLVYSDVLLNDINNSPTIGCRCCVALTSIVTCSHTNRLLFKNFAISYSAPWINIPTDNTLPVLQKNQLYVAASVAMSKGLKRCQCDFLIDSSTALSSSDPDNKIIIDPTEELKSDLICKSCLYSCSDENGQHLKYKNFFDVFNQGLSKTDNGYLLKENTLF